MSRTHSTFEVQVSLRYLEPPIWRTLELPGTATLEDVHLAIQLAMGWTNSHLHRFEIGGREYGMAGLDMDGLEPDFEDERRHTLESVAKAGASFFYEYDFGDSWEHDVTVQRVSTTSKPVAPRCLDGARACPPEDCGGVPGYEGLLEIIANPRHADRDEAMEWLPEGFHPDECILPKGSLARAIEHLRRAADGVDDDEGGDWEDVFDTDMPPPTKLVKQALALPPAQRADLVAVLADSLADEFSALQQLVTAMTAAPRSPSSGKTGKRATAAKPAAKKRASKKKGAKRRGG